MCRWSSCPRRCGAGDSPAAGAVREIREEAGIAAAVEGLIGIQELPDPQNGWLALVFMCRHISGTPEPDYRETDAARFLTAGETDLLSDPVEPWSEWLMRKVLNGELTLISENSATPYAPKAGFI